MKILLAVDGSEYSNAALEEVIRRPWPRGTQVEVLSVAHAIPEFTDPRLMMRTIQMETLEHERKRAHEVVEKAAAALAEEAPLLAVTTRVVEGSPKESVVLEAADWGADLIVMGSHGYGAAMRFLLGSVSHAVALHAPCSVEIVRKRSAQAA